MTPPAETTSGDELAAPVAPGLLMVGASGAVCVDGVCVIEPAAESTQPGGPDAA